MKWLSSTLVAISLALAGPAYSEPIGHSGLIGKWAVDVSRLPIPAEVRPKSVSVTFAEAEGGRLFTRVEVVDPNGAVLYAESVAELNGTPVVVKGNLEADTAAVSMPAPGVLVMQLSRAGVPGSTRIYTVAADRKSMTETAANFGEDGRPVMRTHQFSRVQ
ncbi:hypothetical protein [Inhella proteolytica]|uniref:LuxR family transcriptional regulator n=1 Tax=Inhella proteolytica TaxID=2795029 RepID=A0A931J972_9BURK|nr:hypothetical protein [Inhella proteolytica]MBH9579102.1 hypothetical protein [Inhella proteolytica]